MPSPPGREELATWLADRGSGLDPAQWLQLDGFLKHVGEYNEKTNITADSGAALYLRHAADAFSALPILKARLGAAPTILDLGAGAGFVGITLKIAWPAADVTLLEASHRKFSFLNLACSRIPLTGLHAALGRAPAAPGGKKFDAVLVRALAPLEESARMGLALARPEGGICVLFQTQAPPAGEPGLARALSRTGGRLLETLPYRLPDEQTDRHLVLLGL